MNTLKLAFLVIAILIQGSIFAQTTGWKWLIEPSFDRVTDFYSGYALVKQNGKWGFMNADGEIQIPCIYNNVDAFINEKAMVEDGNYWILIDKKGDRINNINYNRLYRFHEGLAVTKTVSEFGLEGEEWYGFINIEGKDEIKPKYTGAKYFSEGLAPVKRNGKWGYINRQEDVVIEFKYNQAEIFRSGLALVENENHWKFINSKGQILSGNGYDEARVFSEGFAAVSKNGKWGFINEKFDLMVDYTFEDVHEFSDGLVAVQMNNKWGFINKNGERVIEYKYKQVSDFIKGNSFVKKDDSWGCIDKKGLVIVDFQFDDVRHSLSNLVAVQKEEQWGYIYIRNRMHDVRQYVLNKMENWESKGRYEKTESYLKRVNEKTRELKSQEFTQEAINNIANSEISLSVNGVYYDADNESFKILFEKLNPIYLNVPIAEAESFDVNISEIIFGDPQFTFNERNDFELLRLTATNPNNGKEYKYNATDLVAYNVTKLNMSFNEIHVEVNKVETPQINETINIVNVGKSDVDINIPETQSLNKNTFAVVIGNEEYQHEINVDYAINDAKIFGQYLIKTMGIPENQVHLLNNASMGELMHELDWLNKIAKGFQGDAKVIFYYAGHGMPSQSTKEAYVLPVDGYSSNIKTCIKLDDIYKQLNQYTTESVIVFLDACFSGAGRKGMLTEGRGVKIIPKEEVISDNMVVFSAVSGDEIAHPFSEKEHGLFTYYLLKKLKETKGEVTLGELGEYLTKSVLRKSVVLHKEQNPTIKVHDTANKKWKNWKMK